jgi:hypothetical protein
MWHLYVCISYYCDLSNRYHDILIIVTLCTELMVMIHNNDSAGISGNGSLLNTPSSSSSSSSNAVYSSSGIDSEAGRIGSGLMGNSFIEHYCDYTKSTEYNYSMKRLSESLKKQMKVANETSGAFYVTDTDTLLINGKKVDSLGNNFVSKDDLSESDVSLSGEIIDVKNNLSNLKKLNNALIKSGNEDLAKDLDNLGKRKLSDSSMNTEEQEPPIYVGKYARERSELDYTFHEHYIPERQLFHDILIDQFFQTTVTDKNSGLSCERPRDNWLVFTAGCMGAGKGHTVSWLHSQVYIFIYTCIYVNYACINMHYTCMYIFI